MLMRGLARGKRRARLLPDRLLRRPLILGYHRVATLAGDPLLLAVRPEHFAQHLEVLSRLAAPTPLSKLASALDEGRRARGAVVITFDDGYLDNLVYARPLLERGDVPATVFVTTGLLGQMFWWDELERLVLAPPTIPASLRLELDGGVHEWRIDDDRGTESRDNWNVLAGPGSPRQRLFVELQRFLRALEPIVRDEALSKLARWSNAAPPPPAETRSLTEPEIAELAVDNLVSIGAHTDRHPVLAALKPDSQRDEIVRSRDFLAHVLGRPPTTFAYPYGGVADYDHHSIAIVRDNGFSCACTTIPGTIGSRTSPFELPRFLVRDWNGDEFERRLRSLFHD